MHRERGTQCPSHTPTPTNAAQHDTTTTTRNTQTHYTHITVASVIEKRKRRETDI